jgi:SAM-dependent methyltransferase
MIWRCPKCKDVLVEREDGVECRSCTIFYRSVGGILDLRHPPDCADYETDRADALSILKSGERLSLEELVNCYHTRHGRGSEKVIRLRTRQAMSQPPRLRKEIRGWLQRCVTSNGTFLDVGCGTGGLLAAAAAEGRTGIGIDLSLTKLVVARRMIVEWGGEPVLAAALGEELPLADDSVSSVVSLDVIEHVDDRVRYLREIDRVAGRGGHVAFATPNRYSLTAEPHLFIWGVGWLPRALQRRYVKWRTGRDYNFTCLLSTGEAAKLLRQNTRFQFEILVPLVPEEEISYFPPARAALARLYNHLAPLRWLRWVFLRIGPFFRIVGRKT